MPFKILVQRATIAVELERKIVETLNAIIERSGARLALGCCQYVFGHSILAGCPRFAVIETQPRSVVKCSLTKKRRVILTCRRSIPKQSIGRGVNFTKKLPIPRKNSRNASFCNRRQYSRQEGERIDVEKVAYGP